MLVLTRKPGQSIVIGESIEIFVVEARGDSVRIGINAPREVSIVRREILDAVRDANQAAAASDAALLEAVNVLLSARSDG